MENVTLGDSKVSRGKDNIINNPDEQNKNNKSCKRFFVISEKNPTTKRCLRSNFSILKEKMRHEKLGNAAVPIHPLSLFRMWWEAFMVPVYFSFYIARPLRLSYWIDIKHLYVGFIDIYLFIIDLIFLVDSYLTFKCGFITESPFIITLNKKKVMWHYLTGFFLIDIVSSLPLDFFVICISNKGFDLFIYAQVLSLLKITRFQLFLRYASDTVKIFLKKKILQRRIRHRFIEIIFLLNLSVCLFNVVGNLSTKSNYEDNMLFIQRFNISSSHIYHFQYGFLFAFSTLATAGYGPMRPMHILEIISSLIAMTILGMYKYYLCAFFNEEYRGAKISSNEYLEMYTQVEEYVHHKQLSVQTQKRFLNYFEHTFQQRYYREKYLLSSMSEHLKAEVMLNSCKNIISNKTFESIPQNTLGAIISHLRYEVYLPNDVIIRAGSVGDCMYFISHGTVAMYTPTGKEMFHLDNGDYFGEISLIMKDGKRVTTVVALEITELFRLDRKDFRELVATDEGLLKKIETVAALRMNKTILSEKIHSKARGFSE